MVRKTTGEKLAYRPLIEAELSATERERAYAMSDRQHSVSRRAQALLAAAGLDRPARRWFVLAVDNGRDGHVAETLVFSGSEVWVPYVTVKMTRRGGVKKGARPTCLRLAMPGYVFVRVEATDDAWAGLASVKGVAGILGAANRPSAVPDATVVLLQAYLTGDPQAGKIVTDAVAQGDRVIVKDGPFVSFPGTVDNLDDDTGRAVVEILIFGRATPVTLDLVQLSKL